MNTNLETPHIVDRIFTINGSTLLRCSDDVQDYIKQFGERWVAVDYDPEFFVIVGEKAIPDGVIVGKGIDRICHPIQQWLNGWATERQHGVFRHTSVGGANCIHRLMHKAINGRNEQCILLERTDIRADLTEEEILEIRSKEALLRVYQILNYSLVVLGSAAYTYEQEECEEDAFQSMCHVEMDYFLRCFRARR